ncbi:MAG: hypothetical protein ABS79_07030 [Planctomycetes bacterium SCN 63-9]|nr:MAG: hypothetical protein ABS79_07030 [Planctomycetes bacterium SCN 63-9]
MNRPANARHLPVGAVEGILTYLWDRPKRPSRPNDSGRDEKKSHSQESGRSALAGFASSLQSSAHQRFGVK